MKSIHCYLPLRYAFVALLLICAARHVATADVPEGIVNTQDPQDVPPAPEEAVKKFTAPDGFRVTLFAGEPNVAQPISIAFDDRGRLWVVESYAYPDWTKTGRDRVLIFEDTDGDGRFDVRKVFYDGGRNLTGIEIGFGGVWLCSAPNLIFIPDADGDDVPDGEPVVKLDGWTLKARHNIFNGLVWGPDGWLYGCHGIVEESRVGRPGTPDDERVRLRCGIWRYHPVREAVEVVCHGTTNPWGLDFDEHGEGFFTNCVIGHLWHVIPGARYQRMYGNDYNSYAYELIGATSDHLHWGGGDWRSSRGGEGKHSEAGGGHAHVGAMIYRGDNWPAEYRGRIFMNNIHGNRVNQDILQRQGSGYVGIHGKDFLFANDPWFRGVAIRYGAEGAVYISDWADLGECHDNDGVHRTSGRIYRVSYGQTKSIAGLDLANLDNRELVKLQLHENAWHARHARRLLQERAAAGDDMTAVHEELKAMFEAQPNVSHKLRAMWALNVAGGADEAWLHGALEHENEHVRGWAVRLLCDGHAPSDASLERFTIMAAEDESALVRLNLASALQRVEPADRWEIATALAGHAADADDHNLPLMIWYGIEPAVPEDKTKAISLLTKTKIPKLRQFITKRIAEAAE